MRKLSALLLGAVVAIVSLLPGCAPKSGASARVRAIPKDGIVRKAELAAVKQSGDIAIYRGKSGGIAYEWTFVGPDIQKPADVNLKVSFHPADESALSGQAAAETFIYATAQKTALPGNPTLSITMGNGWEDGSYPLYTWSGGSAAAAGDALVVSGKATVSPVPMGECYLLRRPKAASASSAASQAVSAPAAASAVSAASSSPAAASSASSQKSPSSSRSPGSTPAGGPSSASGQTAGKAGNSSAEPSATSDPTAIQVTLTIRCDTAVSKISDRRIVPANGVILPATSWTMHQGDTAYKLLTDVCAAKKINVEHTGSAAYQTAYIKSINGLADGTTPGESNGGPLSGWMYKVNGAIVTDGVSAHALHSGDNVQFLYTCDLGHDLS